MYTAIPSERQLEWHDLEFGVIIHYIMDIYNPEFKGYKTDAVRTELSCDRINPTRLDPEQWVRSAYEAGAKYAVLVCNHCTGFSLWRTKVNDYSCASLKWKNGQGDILREFIDACKKYDIKPGVYYSTGCNGYYNINDEWKHDYKAPYYQEYVKNVEKQITELWSEYGEMFEIWFDGGIIPVEKGGPDAESILYKYQPNALTFQGPKGYKHNLRWVGNEDGQAPLDCWSATNCGDLRADGTVYDEKGGMGDPDGKYYCPAETDVPNRTHKAFGGGWGWKAGETDTVLDTDKLLDIYVNSVGRNTNLLLGMAITTEGDFEDEQQFIDFGKRLKEVFGKSKQSIIEPELTDNKILFTSSCDGDYLSIREDITLGQKIRKFEIKVNDETILSAGSIGHRRIVKNKISKGDRIEIDILLSDVSAKIRDIEVY